MPSSTAVNPVFADSQACLGEVMHGHQSCRSDFAISGMGGYRAFRALQRLAGAGPGGASERVRKLAVLASAGECFREA